MSIKEIVFISGKGGTGKTSMTSSFIALLDNIVIADCDVDAPDLDILIKPELEHREDFIATSKAAIDTETCTNCGNCIDICKFGALSSGDETPFVKEVFCEGCNACSLVCKVGAISLKPYKTGEIFSSKTDYGDMIHARLTPGEEVSGRLVAEVRKRAKNRAVQKNSKMVVIDGPPGIACNVISAITASSLAVIVTEPTVSGLHDLVRVHQTAKKLNVKTAAIINKSGISIKYSTEIKKYCSENKIEILGEVELKDRFRKSVNLRIIPQLATRLMVNKLKDLIYSDS